MSDIVERLRSWQCASTRLKADFDDAADGIERLRAKLAEAQRLLQSLAGCGLTDEHDREIDAFLAEDKGAAGPTMRGDAAPCRPYNLPAGEHDWYHGECPRCGMRQ